MISLKEIIKRIRGGNALPEESTLAVRDMVMSYGWRTIETYFKEVISKNYQQLMSANATNLTYIQMSISAQINMIETIYSLGGLNWQWDGYKDPSHLFKNEVTDEANDDERLTKQKNEAAEFEELQAAYLKKIQDKIGG